MPTIENGGIEKNLIILSDYLIRNGHDVKILTKSIRPNMKNDINKRVKLIISKEYLKFNFINKRIIDSLNVCFHIFKNKNYFKNYTFLSFQSHYIAVIISKIIKTKIILRIANHPVGAVKFFQSKFEYKIKSFLKNTVYKFSDGIVANSKESLNYFKNRSFDNELICIYNPIRILKRKNKIKNKNKKYLLSIGRLEKQKNFLGLLWAFKLAKEKSKNLKLVIVGSGSERSSIEKYIHNNNLEKNVILTGYKKADKYFKISGIFILNSLFEGLPNVLIEALTHKMPIISTRCLSGPNEILSNGKFGYLVPVNDHKSLAKKIIYVVKNYDASLIKAKKGFKSLSRFEYTQQCKMYENFINKINNKNL